MIQIAIWREDARYDSFGIVDDGRLLVGEMVCGKQEKRKKREGS